jgi:uncharacterized protein YecE (DUF72 family)
VRVGISGWRYPAWRGVFYPTGLPQRLELAYAAERMSSIEINGSFYSLQKPGAFAGWRDATPPGFVFAVKGSRFITHMKKLRGVEEALQRFFDSGVYDLGDKLGPLLWQLPEMLHYDEARLDAFLSLLPRHAPDGRRLRHALEPRHVSYAAAVPLLQRHDVALVVADTAGRWPFFDQPTTSDLMYVRLHGDQELYVSGYSDEGLQHWAGRIRAWAADRDVFVYFDNDAKVHAPHDAMRLADRLSA